MREAEALAKDALWSAIFLSHRRAVQNDHLPARSDQHAAPVGQPCRRGEDQRQAADRSQFVEVRSGEPDATGAGAQQRVLVEVLHADDRVLVRKDGRRRAHVAVIVVETERFHEGAAGQHEADEILYPIRQQDEGCPALRVGKDADARKRRYCDIAARCTVDGRETDPFHQGTKRCGHRHVAGRACVGVADDAGLDSGRQLIQHQRAAG